MNAFQKYLLYRELMKRLRNKSVAVKQIDLHVRTSLLNVEWTHDKYVIKSFKNDKKYWTYIVNADNNQTITTLIGMPAKKLYTAAYWLSIEQAPAKAVKDMMQIDRSAIDFAFDEISTASQQKSR